MEVRTGATACVSTQTDGLSGAYGLVFAYQLLGHVSVDGLQSVVVTDYYIFSIAVAIVFYDAHLTGEGCADGVTDIYFDVETAVVTSPTTAEVTGDDAARGGHVESAEVYLVDIRHRTLLVCMGVVPIVIEV